LAVRVDPVFFSFRAAVVAFANPVVHLSDRAKQAFHHYAEAAEARRTWHPHPGAGRFDCALKYAGSGCILVSANSLIREAA